MPLRSFFYFVCVLCLCACARRPGAELFLPVSAPCPQARTVRLLVATDRAPDAAHPGNFTAARSPRLSFAEYAISVPPDHEATRIEWSPRQPVDPAESFAVRSYAPLSEADFLRHVSANATVSEAEAAVVSASDSDRTAKGDAVAAGTAFIFVHGYNNSYAESVLREAQLLADNSSPGPAILFAWPSDGSLADYVADKDAATVSRDRLVRLLTLLAGDRPSGRITLVAHSMGCWLTMESLRQLRLSGRADVLDRVDTVILAAPDIDLDVFGTQVAAVGRLRHPITVLASPDDRALELSSRLGGDRYRLGELDVRDPRIRKLAKEYDIQLIDISNMAATDSLNHDKFIGATAALRAALSPQRSANPLRRAGAFFLDAMASVLEVPGRIGRAAADEVREP